MSARPPHATRPTARFDQPDLECPRRDQIRPFALDRSSQEVARAVVSQIPRRQHRRRRHRRRRTHRLRDGVRVERGGREGRRSSKPIRSAVARRQRAPAGWATSPASGSPSSRKPSACATRAAAGRRGIAPGSTSRRCFAASNIKCALEPLGSTTAARSLEQAQRLKREQKARREAGIDAPLLNARAISGELGFRGARRHPGAGRRDDRSVPRGRRSGARRGRARRAIFERSPVTRITFGRRDADVHTAGGRIRTARVVVATGGPTALFKGLRRHFWFRQTLLRADRAGPGEDSPGARPSRRGRSRLGGSAAHRPMGRWRAAAGDRCRLGVAAGPTARQGHRAADRSADVRAVDALSRHLGHRARLRVGCAVRANRRTACRTSVRIATIPHHLFAFGDSSHSVTGAYLASRILLRHHLERAGAGRRGLRLSTRL